MTAVSIIMRSKNVDGVIGQALTALYAQDFSDFELLIVDSGSTDQTLSIIQKFPCTLTQIPASDYYPGAVLNNIIQQTNSDIIVFQNSDTVPLSSDALDKLLAPFKNPKVKACFARQIPRPEAKAWVKRDYANSFPESGPAPDWMPMSLPFAAIRRSTWEEHPFYTWAWGSEDTEWGIWAKNQGYIIQYVPEALVMHSHNYSLRQLYGRRFIEGEADSYIYKRQINAVNMLWKWAAASIKDILYALKHGEMDDIFISPFRRVVGQWGYYQGHRWGYNRLKNKLNDPSLGQRTVIERQEP